MTKTTTNRAGRPRRTMAERRAQVEALRDRLAAWRDSEDDDALSAYEGRFDHYSARNAHLIVMQCPDATVVRGYGAWQDEGRQVRRGEPGIQILAPAGSSSQGVTIEPEGAAGSTGPAPASEGVTTLKRMYFKITYVWDISQTDPSEATA